MTCQLLADCLNEIFEYLEEDKATLYSCLLVNRLWCEISIRILWRNVWKFKSTSSFQADQVSSKILDTLITCLPNESKEILHKDCILVSTPTSKHPLFNYISFCKVLSINEIDQIIQHFLEFQQLELTKSLHYYKYLILHEILKMYMKQVPFLRELKYFSTKNISNITLVYFPGSIGCLTNLSVLSCGSDIHSEFFYQLSQICRNIQSLTIEFEGTVSNGLKDLISSQNGLKDLSLIQSYNSTDWKEIIPSLIKHSNTLIKLKINGGENDGPLSFITRFKNLQELVLFFDYNDAFEDFKELRFVKFSQLQILKLSFGCPTVEIMIKFFENNGKNLKEFCTCNYDNTLNLAIAKFCPNLKSLFTLFLDNEIETLKTIFNNCQQLESIKVWCGNGYLNESEFFEVLAYYSPKNFYELEIYFIEREILSKDLEKFFNNWKNRIPQKSLSFIILIEDNDTINIVNNENMKIIEKYKTLGIIKKFEIREYKDYEI
ncbi:hypothetical protein RclHR1_04010007 [Rhizophagus clarus]|uniref:F-box domain-containing protein n=1 Tax=Rhizophagus clarus TaxID=94130 RepID=A0A2Z6RVD5_9GLOM|nr:hypothetical protein RclHR1_04010007 [Rhizophagus clarus]GES95510.1 hypothetical protein GLOIN_2v1669543 [Rhizophagus clarus]